MKPGITVSQTEPAAKLIMRIGSPKHKKLIIPSHLHSERKLHSPDPNIDIEESPQEASPLLNHPSDIEKIKNAILSPTNLGIKRSFSQKSIFNPQGQSPISIDSTEMESLDKFNLSIIEGFSKRKEKRSQTHIENERDRYLHLRQKYDELLEYCTHSKFYYEEEIRRLKLEVSELKSSKKYNKSNEKDTEILKELQEIKSKITGLQKRN